MYSIPQSKKALVLRLYHTGSDIPSIYKVVATGSDRPTLGEFTKAVKHLLTQDADGVTDISGEEVACLSEHEIHARIEEGVITSALDSDCQEILDSAKEVCVTLCEELDKCAGPNADELDVGASETRSKRSQAVASLSSAITSNLNFQLKVLTESVKRKIMIHNAKVLTEPDEDVPTPQKAADRFVVNFGN